MKKHTSICLALLMIFLCLPFSIAETLPQMEKVTFPTGKTSPLPENPTKNYKANKDFFGEDGLSYHDDSIDIKLHKIRLHDTPIVVAFVQIATAEQLKTEQAKPFPSKTTVRMSEIAKRTNSILATNADWFTYHNNGIICRNGKLLREKEDLETDGLAIDINGDFYIVRPMTMEEYSKIETPIQNSFSFGPALVMNNEVLEIENRVVTYKQRMAIGQIAPLSYVLVATDGPDQENSVGLSVPQLATLMHNLGAHTAYNLDGGQSTAMIMNNVKVNAHPKIMRAVGDIIYFTTAIAE